MGFPLAEEYLLVRTVRFITCTPKVSGWAGRIKPGDRIYFHVH